MATMLVLSLLLPGFSTAEESGENLFSVSASLEPGAGDTTTIFVRLEIRKPGHIYTDSVGVEAAGLTLEPGDLPPGIPLEDPTGESAVVYDRDTVLEYTVNSTVTNPVTLAVRYRGCTDSTCFMPQTVSVIASQDSAVLSPVNSPEPVNSPATGNWKTLASGFRETGRTMGYAKPAAFTRFLDAAETEKQSRQSAEDKMLAALNRGSLWLTVLLIVGGGLALNLTPCVLPMIPVNIAIIGAGAGAGSRKRGFALGAVYGLGMAAAYGALGLAFVLTGSRFGSLQSFPAFNFAICALFLVLALGMFDVISIDFSIFQGGTRDPRENRQGFAVTLVMGMISALLAGACVAPVVIAVLVYSANLYAAGRTIGLAAPFLLGAGMALPWPFAGAGLSFLPKPGRWMIRVKYAFGVLILILSAYYGMQGVNLVRGSRETGSQGPWLNSLEEAFVISRQSNKPILIDFYADWCKSCVAMDETTFRDPAVQQKMGRFVTARFTANNPRDPAVKEVLDYFGVLGLPTCIVLKPADRKEM